MEKRNQPLLLTFVIASQWSWIEDEAKIQKLKTILIFSIRKENPDLNHNPETDWIEDGVVKFGKKKEEDED